MSRKKKSTGKTAKTGQPRATPPQLPSPSSASSSAPAPAGRGDDGWPGGRRLLERARAQWEHGKWDDILALDPAEVEADPDRARLALLIAAAHSHTGDAAAARRHASQALHWGCSRTLAARVLASAVHNSLGRVAVSLGEDADAGAHFETAIGLVEPRSDAALLARMRRLRETAQMGLLPEAARFIEDELGLAGPDVPDQSARLTILGSALATIRHELQISLKRGQLYASGAEVPGDGTAPGSAPDPATGRPDMAALRARSVSQLGQDIWALEKSGFKRGGYFVEFGATDGVLLSNTWLLETEFGWNGLCAEPNPVYFAELKQNRRCTVSEACIGARTGDEVDFILAEEYGGIADYAAEDMHADRRAAYRTEGQVMRVETISLDDFLRQSGAPRDIDYLSIDTEGSELDILTAFPFDRWNVSLITVEHNNTPQRDALRALLGKAGYRWTQVQFDDWYERTG